ncbi:MAG TPA: glycosyltransferase family 4 protein [Flavobacterium sp.]|nr:glycosyltransferase family 4 protein [Flavobacterium sp.]
MIKKAILFSSEFPPLPGGIGNHAYHLAQKLVKNGYDITVCTNQRSSVLTDDLEFDHKQSFAIHRIQRYSFSLWTYVQRIWISFQMLMSNKPDTIIASGKFSLWQAAFLKLFFSKKQFVAVVHGSELYAGNSISKEMTKWSLSQFDVIIAVSQFTKNLALSINSNWDISVINNGFSVPKMVGECSKIELKGYPKLVTVGNVTYRKGQHNLIDALPKIKQQFPEVHYHIVGLPTERNAFEMRAQELGVFDSVSFHGALSDDQLFHFLASCDVFVMLSERLNNGDVEGFGIAVLEANALGLPAIGSSDSGIADAIHDNYSGKLVEANDIAAINSALETIMNDYEHYSSNAEAWAKGFEWTVVIKNYLKLIE